MSVGQGNDDWYDESPTRVQPPVPPPTPTQSLATPTKRRPTMAPLLILGELVCVGVGIYALLMLPDLLGIIGYVACGIVLPVMWALVFVASRKADQVGDSTGVPSLLLRMNQVLLWVGFAVAMGCALFWAIEVTK